MAMLSQQDTSDDAKLVHYLEGLATALIAAINNRDLCLDSPGWQCVSPSFTTGTNAASYSLGLQQTIETLTTMAGQHPHHKIKVLDMNTHVKRKTGHADIFMNVNLNDPDGLIFSDVGVLEFVMTLSGWKAIRYRAITGIGHVTGGL